MTRPRNFGPKNLTVADGSKLMPQLLGQNLAVLVFSMNRHNVAPRFCDTRPARRNR